MCSGFCIVFSFSTVKLIGVVLHSAGSKKSGLTLVGTSCLCSAYYWRIDFPGTKDRGKQTMHA